MEEVYNTWSFAIEGEYNSWSLADLAYLHSFFLVFACKGAMKLPIRKSPSVETHLLIKEN